MSTTVLIENTPDERRSLDQNIFHEDCPWPFIKATSNEGTVVDSRWAVTVGIPNSASLTSLKCCPGNAGSRWR
jgi:hypothetical protein